MTAFASECRGAIVAMPVLAVHAYTRVSAYVSRVGGACGSARTVRVAVHEQAGGGTHGGGGGRERLVGLLVRGRGGWYK